MFPKPIKWRQSLRKLQSVHCFAKLRLGFEGNCAPEVWNSSIVCISAVDEGLAQSLSPESLPMVRRGSLSFDIVQC